jgi:hypothetical protein
MADTMADTTADTMADTMADTRVDTTAGTGTIARPSRGETRSSTPSDGDTSTTRTWSGPSTWKTSITYWDGGS